MTGSDDIKRHRRGWAVFLGLAAALALVTSLRFAPWTSKLLYGDDLMYYHAFLRGEVASTPWQALTAAWAEKYRPVTHLVIGALFSLFGINIRAYFLVNTVVAGVCGALLSVLAFRLSHSRLIAVLIGMAAVVSRFMLFQITQVAGILEGLGYLFFLLMLLTTLWAPGEAPGERRALQRAFVAVCAVWLMIFTHERYIPVAAWLALVLLFAPAFHALSRRWRIALAALTGAPVVLNIGYKVLVLRQAVMVGTGGTHIKFDLAQSFQHLHEAVFSVFGLNSGPDFLVGFSIPSHPLAPVALVAAGGLLAYVVLAAQAVGSARRQAQWLLVPAALVSLAALVLVPPAITIRMEQRWLVEPFALVLLAAAWSAGQLASRKLALALFTVLAAASMVVDWRLSRSFPRIFFVDAANVAHNVHTVLTSSGARDVTLVANHDVCSWVLLDGAFPRLYAPQLSHFSCIGDIKDAIGSCDRPTPKVYVLQPDDTVAEVSADLCSQVAIARQTGVWSLLEKVPRP